MSTKRKVCYFHLYKDYVGDRILFINFDKVLLNLCMHCDLESNDYISEQFLEVYKEREEEYEEERFQRYVGTFWKPFLKDYEQPI